MKQIAVRKHYVAKNVFGADAKECRVTSRYGTDFTYSVDGPDLRCRRCRRPDFDAYKIINFDKDENRTGGNLYYYLFPTGEFNVAPVEGTANGKLVIDLTMHHLGRLRSPIELTVENGRVTKIEGGADARILRDYLEGLRRRERLHVPGRSVRRRQCEGGRARHPARGQEHHGHDAFRARHQCRCRRLRSCRRSTWTA